MNVVGYGYVSESANDGVSANENETTNGTACRLENANGVCVGVLRDVLQLALPGPVAARSCIRGRVGFANASGHYDHGVRCFRQRA